MIDQRIVIENAADFGRVAVMYGGNSCEREVSLKSGAAVLAALRSRGIDAVGWDPAENDLAKFAAADFARVWIAVHGPGGEDGALQGTLQWLNTPYTGSGILASAVAMDKILSKHLFKAAGITTPDYMVIEAAGDAGVLTMVHAEDASILAHQAAELEAQGRTSVAYLADARPVLAEEVAMMRAVAMAEQTGSPMYAVHVSSERGLRVAQAARERSRSRSSKAIGGVWPSAAEAWARVIEEVSTRKLTPLPARSQAKHLNTPEPSS